MGSFSGGTERQQFDFLKRQFLQEGELAFTSVLTADLVSKALTTIKFSWNDRIYTPLATLWIFLSQVMSTDHSCRAAVARWIAHRAARGLGTCSSDTGAYCQARKRLPEEFFSTTARQVGRSLDDQVDRKWLWKGRAVYMFDGTTVSMPDTPANQKAYPQLYNQRRGLGFPIARVCTIVSLACGAVRDLAICRYAGKGQGELTMLRQLSGMFSQGDVLLTDALMSTWREMYQLKQRGVDSVSRLNKALRSANFRRGTRLGKDDHIVRWPKPWMRDLDRATYRTFPDCMEVREVRVRVTQPGFRTKEIIVVTTILDPNEASKEDLANLFRSRWNHELDLRNIKVTLQMDVLRCKTPEMVRKEIWTHILANNLIRTVMAQAASRHRIEPRTISFKGTLQTLEAFQPLLATKDLSTLAARKALYEQVLDAIANHRVADRPDRYEPRKRKRKPRTAAQMTKPRWELKRLMRQGVTEI
ncbi:MAG: IS4 family transposase [Pirellulaceae bacterium]